MESLSLKGVPTPEIMEKVDKVKKIIIDDIHHPWRFLFYKKWLREFNKRYFSELANITGNKFLQVADSAFEIGDFSFNFLSQLVEVRQARIFSCIVNIIIGYDMAYRLRIQDMLNEMVLDENTYNNPKQELKRLWVIYERRESVIPTYMIPKSRKVFNLILWSLYLPRINRSFVYALKNLDQDSVKFTDDDKEWIKVRTDYKFYE